MKRLLPLLALALLPTFAAADTIDLGAHGTLTVAPPKGWTITKQKEEDAGYVLIFSPPADVNAQLVLNVVFPPDRQPLSKEAIRDEALAAGDQWVESSVEKKKVIRELKLASGYGAYCVFTDASRVGKAAEKDNFKIVASGILWLSEDVKAGVVMMADDENGPEFRAMLETVSGATLAKR
jgi:hypothetical protein